MPYKNIDLRRATQREWRRKNLEKARAKRRKSWLDNKDKELFWHKRWVQNNRERVRELGRLAYQRKRDYINTFKSQPCADCGKTYPPYVMDFDHLEDKTECIGRLMATGASLVRLKVEINKCEVVCANCHRIRTFYRRKNQ